MIYLVADYDPLNDDRGSLSRGYEPTSKSMQSTSKFKIKFFGYYFIFLFLFK